MNEFIEEAGEELKRLDHIIFVSLKYTRTVDVIRNALTRMITTFDKIMDALLEDAHQKKLIHEVPKNPRKKNHEILKLYGSEPQVAMFMEFYLFLRNLMKAPHTKRDEYRRHVTMIADFINATSDISIDVLEDSFYPVATRFFEYMKLTILGEHDEIH